MASKDLKITFSGDTKSYRQEVDKAALATNKFQKDAGSSMSDLAGVFGVNTTQIKSSIDGMSKGFGLLLSSMKASTTGATVFEGAMKIVKIAAISTGIGALVVVVGSLITYFTQTREGANFVKTAMAALGAAVRVVVDHFSSFGEGIFKLFKGDWAGAVTAFKASVSGIGTEMLNNASAAAELERRTQAVNKAERESKVINDEKLAQAAELRLAAREQLETNPEKAKKMLIEARGLVKSVFEDEKGIAQERLSIFQSQISMHKKSSDDLNQEAELKRTISQIDRESAEDQKALLRETSRANKAIIAQQNERIEAEKKARKERLEASGGEVKPIYANTKEVTTKETKLGLQNVQEYKDQLNRANIASKDAAIEMKKTTLDLSSTLNSAWSGAADGLGEFIGNLASGQASIADFGTVVASAFADLAVNVGKQMIAFGAAGIALKMLIKNPWLALAAGIALVAVGTMAKSKISASIASGGANSSASNGSGSDVNSSGARQSSVNPSIGAVNITVGGQFTLQNGVLVAAINQENQRKAIVT